LELISLRANRSDDFNNMFLSAFKCSFETYFICDLVTNGDRAYDSFLVNWDMARQQLYD